MTKLASTHLFAFHGEPTSFEEVSLELAEKCVEHELRAVERALADWCERCGVSPEEFGQHYGYKVVRDFGDDGTKFSVVVSPHCLSDQPPEWGNALP